MQHTGSIFRGQTVLGLIDTCKMGPKDCPEMLVTNYQSMLHNITPEWRSHSHCNKSLKPCKQSRKKSCVLHTKLHGC